MERRAPSHDLLVIRRNHKTGEVSLDPLRWGLIPYCCEDPKGGRKPINAKCETVRTLPSFREAYRFSSMRACVAANPLSKFAISLGRGYAGTPSFSVR
jgi:putative SOS response-associated peptidase YedK